MFLAIKQYSSVLSHNWILARSQGVAKLATCLLSALTYESSPSANVTVVNMSLSVMLSRLPSWQRWCFVPLFCISVYKWSIHRIIRVFDEVSKNNRFSSLTVVSMVSSQHNCFVFQSFGF